MAYIQLRRTLTLNTTGVGALYTATVAYFDTVLRKPYYTQVDSQVNDPAELAKGAEVYRYEYRPGKVRAVYYNGNASVYTRNLTSVAFSTLAVKADTIAPYTESEDSADASVDLTGTLGQPPYQITLVGTLGTPSAGYRQEATSYSENYPVRFTNLPQGQYVSYVQDARHNQAVLDITVTPGPGRARGVLLLERRLVIGTTHLRWRFNSQDIKNFAAPERFPLGMEILPYGTYVDGYLLPGGLLWRQVYSDGKGGVYFLDTSTAIASTLELDNLIEFHPDTPTGLGGFVVEMNATALPLTFAVGGQTNQTGRFDGLPAGNHLVRVTDALGAERTVPVLLACRYGLRWLLTFSDKDGTPVRVELWLLDYEGTPDPLIGSKDPVILKSDGLNSENGGQGDVPPVVGTSCQLNLLMPAATFEQVLIGDEFLCRVDVYYGGQLEFRGYVQPGLSNQPLLPGAQAISLTATDGLAQLKDAAMVGHVGQRLYGHRPILHTLLHCLSRTNVALPLALFVNRRDATMSDADAPEEAATTNRTGYWNESKNDPVPQREAVEGVAQALGGTLCQRNGTWQVRSALEALADAPGRAYLPAGTPAGPRTALAPANAIRPPRAGTLCWLEAQQLQQVRAGWKSLAGSTDVGWLKNAFPAGAVFSDKNAWLPDYSRLRPLAGWHPAPKASFPLLFTRVGEKGTDYATEWPRSLNLSQADGRYLESPLLPLAAGTEAVPAYLTFSGKLVPTEYYQPADPAANRSYVRRYEFTSTGAPTITDWRAGERCVFASGGKDCFATAKRAGSLGAPSATQETADWQPATDPTASNQVASPSTAAKAVLAYEVLVDGQSTGQRLAELTQVAGSSTKDVTFEVALAPLPSTAGGAVLRVHSWIAADNDLLTSAQLVVPVLAVQAFAAGTVVRYDFGTGVYRLFVARQDEAPAAAFRPEFAASLATFFAEIPATNVASGRLLLSSIAVQLRPQQATWDGEDNLRVDGPGGTERPTEVLKVYHPDPPLSAGLFGGNLYAFGRGVGLLDGTQPTSWARSIDLAPAPLFESNVLDGLALRAGASRLLTGPLYYEAQPPRLLDSLDTPSDVPGRRFMVAANEWHLKKQVTEVSLIEIGPGADAPDPLAELPEGVRIIHEVYQYTPGKFTPVVRTTQDGRVRVRQS